MQRRRPEGIVRENLTFSRIQHLISAETALQKASSALPALTCHCVARARPRRFTYNDPTDIECVTYAALSALCVRVHSFHPRAFLLFPSSTLNSTYYFNIGYNVDQNNPAIQGTNCGLQPAVSARFPPLLSHSLRRAAQSPTLALTPRRRRRIS